MKKFIFLIFAFNLIFDGNHLKANEGKNSLAGWGFHSGAVTQLCFLYKEGVLNENNARKYMRYSIEKLDKDKDLSIKQKNFVRYELLADYSDCQRLIP